MMPGCDLCRPLIFRRADGSRCEACGGPIGSVCYPLEAVDDVSADTRAALLDVLADLDDDALALYGLRADSTAPLDEALLFRAQAQRQARAVHRVDAGKQRGVLLHGRPVGGQRAGHLALHGLQFGRGG